MLIDLAYPKLSLKLLISTAADGIVIFFLFLREKARQMIHMKCQALFSLKNNKNNSECGLLQLISILEIILSR